jgi:hypothetical protein
LSWRYYRLDHDRTFGIRVRDPIGFGHGVGSLLCRELLVLAGGYAVLILGKLLALVGEKLRAALFGLDVPLLGGIEAVALIVYEDDHLPKWSLRGVSGL